jgi:hypothetical protein
LACAPKRAAVRAGVFLATFQPPTRSDPKPRDFLVQGLLPNKVRKVIVLVGDHQHRVVVVTHNVMSFEADQPVHVERLIWN